jgi:plasmid maintenance system antidote protein VapI
LTPQFWLNLQAAYDLAVAEDALGVRLMRQVKVLPRSA